MSTGDTEHDFFFVLWFHWHTNGTRVAFYRFHFCFSFRTARKRHLWHFRGERQRPQNRISWRQKWKCRYWHWPPFVLKFLLADWPLALAAILIDVTFDWRFGRSFWSLSTKRFANVFTCFPFFCFFTFSPVPRLSGMSLI